MKVEDTPCEGIHGWGCTPTGEPPPNAVSDTTPKKYRLPLWLTKGWKRTTLYGIILFLMILVFLNIALTLWIICTLRLTTAGIGPMTIVKDGIRLDGQAWIENNLIASKISSQPSQPITLHSHRNFTIVVTEPDQEEQAKLVIKREAFECSGQEFNIHDAKGASVLHASRDEVRVFADTLAVEGEGGVVARSSLQTPLVRAPPGDNLQLESLTRKLDLRAPQSIFLESRAGSIEITSHNDIKLDSVVGAIRIDAPNIIITNLKEATFSDKPHKNIRGKKVYQVCACASGKLFLAAPDAQCSMQENDTELCR